MNRYALTFPRIDNLSDYTNIAVYLMLVLLVLAVVYAGISTSRMKRAMAEYLKREFVGDPPDFSRMILGTQKGKVYLLFLKNAKLYVVNTGVTSMIHRKVSQPEISTTELKQPKQLNDISLVSKRINNMPLIDIRYNSNSEHMRLRPHSMFQIKAQTVPDFYEVIGKFVNKVRRVAKLPAGVTEGSQMYLSHSRMFNLHLIWIVPLAMFLLLLLLAAIFPTS